MLLKYLFSEMMEGQLQAQLRKNNSIIKVDQVHTFLFLKMLRDLAQIGQLLVRIFVSFIKKTFFFQIFFLKLLNEYCLLS